MDLAEKKLFAEYQERMRELEGWLAMLIVRHGDWNGSGWQYDMTHYAATLMRGAMPRDELVVSVGYDFDTDTHTLTAL